MRQARLHRHDNQGRAGASLASLTLLLGAGCDPGAASPRYDTCPAGTVLVESTCRKVCERNEDCDEGGLVCDAEEKVCVTPATTFCSGDVECVTPGPCQRLEGARCDNGACIYDPCGPGYTCENSVCQLRPGLGDDCAGAPERCLGGLECEAGVCCDASGGPCCRGDADCPSGFACGTAIFACPEDCDDFESTACADPEATVCYESACVAKRELGADCLDDAQCLSGHCANGVCCESECLGLCQQCGSDGTCDETPSDDPGCIVDCDVLDTVCRDYHDLTSARCASFGQCKLPTAELCTAFTDAPSTTVCHPSRGLCDIEERCDGAGQCPPDAVREEGFSCRPLQKGSQYELVGCDVVERCDGLSPECPSDEVAPQGTGCRDPAGDCDLGAVCPGPAGLGDPKECPPSTMKTAGTECRAAVPGTPGSPPLTSAADTCDLAEVCDGEHPQCPLDGYKPQGTVCRPAVLLDAGGATCDIAEVCTGTSPTCPATDAHKALAAVCREAVVAADGTTCDTADTCGFGPSGGTWGWTCEDKVLGSGTTCRARSSLCPSDSVCCDVADTCNGTSKVCTDARRPATYTCRAASGQCDVADTCAGSADGIVCTDNKAPPCTTCNTNEKCDAYGACGATTCGSTCCAASESCTSLGGCCAPANVCGADCCTAGETCCGYQCCGPSGHCSGAGWCVQ